MSTQRRFSGPLERLAVSAATAAAKDPAAVAAKIDPDTLLRALNFALLGSGSRAFVWKSSGGCVVVSDTYSADGNCRFTEVLHLDNFDASRIAIQQYQLKYSDGIEDCVESEL